MIWLRILKRDKLAAKLKIVLQSAYFTFYIPDNLQVFLTQNDQFIYTVPPLLTNHLGTQG